MIKLIKPFVILLALAVLINPLNVAAADGIEPGLQAPDFTLTGIDGQEHKLSDYLGKVVVLEWTNHGCPFVQKHYGSGNMQRLQQEMTAHDDVVWLSIVSSAPGKQGYTTPEEAQAIVEKVGAKATMRLLDPSGEVGLMYGAKTTPHMFVIDKQGKISYMGAIDDDPSANPAMTTTAHNYVSAAVGALLEGRTPEITQTRPYGCGVKYDLL